MARSNRDQGNLFGEDEPELFDENAAPRAYAPDPDDVRIELNRLLAEVRAAKTLPWTPRKVTYYRKVFPQMAGWLPDDEADQLRFAFAEELARLEAA